MLPNIRVNGRMFTRRSVSVRPNGAFRIVGVDSLDWSDEVQTELVGGMNEGGIPLGKALGNYSCAASIGVYLDEVQAFETQLQALSPLATSLAEIVFQLVINIREDARIYNATLVNCSIVGRQMAVGNDGSALIRQYTLQPTVNVENGKSLARLIPAI